MASTCSTRWSAPGSTPAAASPVGARTPHDAAAVDVLAAAPVLSATTLARVLGIAVKNAIRILDTLVAADIAIEVTHRSKRRLFGLQGLTPLRDVVQPPYRPEPGRGRGRPSCASTTRTPTRRRCRPSRRSSVGHSITPRSKRRWRTSMLSCAHPGLPCVP